MIEEKFNPEYEDLKYLHGIISKESYNYIKAVNESTVTILGEQWIDNLKANKRYWRKQQKLIDTVGLGTNKCVIGIGSGPSFNKNKDVLKEVVNRDGVNNWNDRNFITISANHQFKPLLEMGIIPDFVLLVDASDVVLDQLTKDISKEAKNVTLICGAHCSPKVIETWIKQGRSILFYSSPMKQFQDEFRKYIKRDPLKHKIELGGNVVNGAWMIGMVRFRSNIFMGVGNDLSFNLKGTPDEQRNNYYSDNDYSTNIKGTGTGRDEANCPKKWGGVSITKRTVWMPGESKNGLNRYNIKLDIVGTSHTLWVYKTWLETTILGQTQNDTSFHYFNCTEGGILGVLAKEDNDEALRKDDNWYLLDEASKNVHTGVPMYHTAMLEDAVKVYLKAKENHRWQGNQGVIHTAAQTAGVLGGEARSIIVANVNH